MVLFRIRAQYCISIASHPWHPQEWAASDPTAPPATWVYAGDTPARHDAAHLVTWRATMPLSALASTLQQHLGGAGGDGENNATSSSTSSTAGSSRNGGGVVGGASSTSAPAAAVAAGAPARAAYGALLRALDEVVCAEIDHALSALPGGGFPCSLPQCTGARVPL